MGKVSDDAEWTAVAAILGLSCIISCKEVVARSVSACREPVERAPRCVTRAMRPMRGRELPLRIGQSVDGARPAALQPACDNLKGGEGWP
jgi:hypothetical protein